MAQEDNVNTPLIAVIGVISTALIFVVIAGLRVFYASMVEAETLRKAPPVTYPALADYRDRERETLNGYRWIDSTKGVASIPIDRAIDLVVRENASDRSNQQPAEATATTPASQPQPQEETDDR
jgi:hypothetical protein